MVVIVGGKVVEDGSNSERLSEEKEEVDSVVEAEVVDEDEDGNEFSKFVNQLPKVINREEGSPAAKADPPEGESPAAVAAKAAVAAAVANIGGVALEDDGGGKLPAKPTTTSPVERRGRQPQPMRTEIDPEKDARFLATVETLKEFKRLNGHTNVPYLRPPNLTTLMSWCAAQRRLYRSGKIHPSRIELLDSIGFEWSAPKRGAKEGGRVTWEQRLNHLKAYKEAHGTLTVDKETLREEEMQLMQWCSNQRLNYQLGKLDAGRVQKLDEVGFDWSEPETGKEKRGNKRTLTDIINVSPVAKRARRNPATPEAVVVDESPAPLPADEDEWVAMFNKLKKLKRKNKPLPTSFPEDKALDRWVRHQKQELRKEDLHRLRMERLVGLGFELPPGVTKATYQKKNPPAPKAKKSPFLQQLPKKASPGAKAPPAFPPAPPGIIPGAPPAGVVPPGAYPGMPWNPFMFTTPYAPPGMPNPYMPHPPGQPAPAAAKTAAAKKAGSPAAGASKQAPGQTQQYQFLQAENAKLQAENQQLRAMHQSMMTSLEEEKMVRRQGNQELQTKIDKQEQIITIQGSTIKKQGSQIKQLMDQMKDVVSRQKEQLRVEEEKRREEERRKQAAVLQEQERQRQREMQELQRQQEEQERLEQQRRHQEEQRRQNELYVLRQHGLF